jgi:hypothetical protein
LGLEGPLKFGGGGGIAASTRVPFWALITAYEDVFSEFGHDYNSKQEKRAAHGGPSTIEF